MSKSIDLLIYYAKRRFVQKYKDLLREEILIKDNGRQHSQAVALDDSYFSVYPGFTLGL